MSTYLISEEVNITRQEGDTADIVITVPSTITLSDFTEIKMQVKNGNNLMMGKTLSGETITVNGQTITIPLLTTDTKNKSGLHRWELELSSTTQTITIARGNFTIIKEIIT